MYYNLNDYIQQARIATGILDQKVYAGPWHVQIDLTNRCNNDCIACWCNSPLLGDKAMSSQEQKIQLSRKAVFHLIDELAALGTRDIYFTGGGEPFMHPEILDFMKHVKQKGMRLDMSTNFTLVSKEIAQELVDIGIDHMNLSLWAANGKTYAVQHPNKNEATFSQMTEIIDYIEELKIIKKVRRPELGMYNVINSYNYNEIPDMLNYAFQHKIRDISYVPVDTVPEGTENLQLNEQQRKIVSGMIAELPAKRKHLKKKYNHDVHFTNLDVFARRIESQEIEQSNYDKELLDALPSCYAGWSFARILANGDVNSCLKSFKIPIGNINDDNFTDIWFGEKQRQFRKHSIDYNLDDPYFKQMGNDRATREQGCYKCCDNIGLNMSIHEKMNNLNYPKKMLIKLVTRFSPLKNISTRT